jgi:exodeoxyribonuclease V alpha subunit
MNPPITPGNIGMDQGLVDSLLKANTFSPLDVHFGKLMAGLSGKGTEELFLAAALASHYRREGHICFDLSSRAGKKIQEEDPDSPVCPKLGKWLSILEREEVVGKPGEYRPLVLDGSRLYLYRYWDYEKQLIDNLRGRILNDPAEVNPELLKDGLKRLFPQTSPGETDWQKVAAFASVLKRFCVISGGPGTGKTFTVAKIMALLLEQKLQPLRIALAAPTGKAAARMQEAIKNARDGLNCPEDVKAAIPAEASTIHRLLGTIPDSPYFRFDAQNPLPADVVAVDEASMVDLALLSKLAQAIPSSSRIILLGDKDQLASVEAGAVLGDICDTGNDHGFSSHFLRLYQKVAGEKIIERAGGPSAPGIGDSIVQLRKSYRFGPASGIGEVSRAVNEGDGPRAVQLLKSGSYGDVQWRGLPRPETLPAALREKAIEGFRPYLKEGELANIFDLFIRVRILCALREGPYGVHTLNLLVEQILRDEGLIRREGRWYRGRPVLITRNDYHLRLFNGDVGITLPDPDAGGELRVFFPGPEGTPRKYPPLRLPEHDTVFAMTVHKSQGSEFDRVLFLMPDRSVPVLTRELVYTAITRAKEKVEVWGREEIFQTAVSRRISRTSGLRDALWG